MAKKFLHSEPVFVSVLFTESQKHLQSSLQLDQRSVWTRWGLFEATALVGWPTTLIGLLSMARIKNHSSLASGLRQDELAVFPMQVKKLS